MTENFDELDQRIIYTLDSFLLEANTVPYIGNRPWTNRIKELLGELIPTVQKIESFAAGVYLNNGPS